MIVPTTTPQPPLRCTAFPPPLRHFTHGGPFSIYLRGPTACHDNVVCVTAHYTLGTCLRCRITGILTCFTATRALPSLRRGARTMPPVLYRPATTLCATLHHPVPACLPRYFRPMPLRATPPAPRYHPSHYPIYRAPCTPVPYEGASCIVTWAARSSAMFAVPSS